MSDVAELHERLLEVEREARRVLEGEGATEQYPTLAVAIRKLDDARFDIANRRVSGAW